MPVSDKIEYADMVAATMSLLKFRATELVLFHVIEAPVTSSLDNELFAESMLQYEAQFRPLSEWLSQQGYKVQIKVAAARHVVDAIVEEALSSNYSFIFMMKRRRKTTIFSKSITEQVIRRVNTPVVSVLL